jgi:hypothetical protein
MATGSNLLQKSREIVFSCLIPTLLVYSLLGARRLNAAIEDARSRSDIASIINSESTDLDTPYFSASGLFNRNLEIHLADEDPAECSVAVAQFAHGKEPQDSIVRNFSKEMGFETISCQSVREEIR